MQLYFLHHPLQLRQPTLEIRSHHLLHRHEQAHRLADEGLPAEHAPDHVGPPARFREHDIGVAGAGERPREIRHLHRS